MTICIAALYEQGQGVVLASDQMITAHFPIGYEYEHDEATKIVSMIEAESVYALLAGDVLMGNQIIDRARANVRAQGVTTASGIAELVRIAYKEVRLAAIVSMEIEPRGLSLNDYYSMQSQLAPHIIQMIDQALSASDLGVQIIVAGHSENGCTIHTIIHPGLINDHTPVGYAAIGSGAPHAVYSLIETPYKPSLSREKIEEVVWNAKKRSEVAPGVGTETQTVIIPCGGENNAEVSE